MAPSVRYDSGSASAAGAATLRDPLRERSQRVARRWSKAPTELDKRASVELSSVEIDALKLLKLKQKSRVEVIPDGMPSIAMAVRWLAELGGYSGNSNAGHQARSSSAEAWRKLATAVEILEEIRESNKMR